MGGVASAVSSAVSSVVDTVGTAVEDVGEFADKNIVKPVVKAVDDTIKAAEQDPLAAMVHIAAIAAAPATGGASLAYASAFDAANTLAHGGSIEQALTNSAISYAAGQAGSMVDPGFSEAALNASARGAASGAAGAAMRGGDVTTGALSGAINAGGNYELNSLVNGPSSSGGLPSNESQDSQSSQTPDDSYTYKPLSDDYSVNADYGLHGTSPGLQAELAQTNFVGGDTPVDYALTLKDPYQFSDLGFEGAGLHESMSPNIKKMNGAQGLTGTDDSGVYSALGYTPYGASPNLGDPNSFINNPDVLGGPVGMTDTSLNLKLPRVNFAQALGLGSQAPQMPSLASSASAKPKSEKYGSPSLLDGSNLAGDSTGDPFYLMHLKQLYSSLTPSMQQALMSNNGNSMMPSQGGANFASNVFDQQSPLYMASGGSTTSSKTEESIFPQATTGVSRGPLIGGGQRRALQVSPLTQLNPQIGLRHAKGGLTVKHPAIPKGHKPEFITGETGYYASGSGTGQSDDIPAVLRHGDYVMDADTVAALGDGSSKAGAQALEKFRSHLPVRAKSGGNIIPAQIADGEYVLPEAFVTALGNGDNAHGAKILDGMRKQVREHKRSAPTSKIPPKAKSPLEYIKMGKKG